MITERTIAEINRRMRAGMARYGKLEDYHRALGALVIELHEVVDAMHKRDPVAMYGELLDVANVAIRFAQELDEMSSDV